MTRDRDIASGLDRILRRRDVTTLMRNGVNLERCVVATMPDGGVRGFDAVIVKDGCGTPFPDHARDAILCLTRVLCGFTTTTTALIAALASSPFSRNKETRR